MDMNLFRDRNLTIRLGIGILLLCIVALTDFLTGPEIATSIFYLLVVIYFTAILGARGGVPTAVVCAILWFCWDVLAHRYSHPAIPYWNASVRLAIFIIMAVILGRLRMEIRRQKVLNEELARKNEEIARLADIKSEFASMVSHELRTPLTSLKENLAVVQDGSVGPLTVEQKDFLDTAKESIDRLSRLINEVLDFQRLESGRVPYRLQPEDLNSVVMRAATNFSLIASKKGIKLKCELEPDLPPAEMDLDRMGQVLYNLIQNAIVYSDHGTVTLRTWFSGGEVNLSVEDQGKGIMAAEIPKLFESFQRLSSSRGVHSEGAGLGLAICKRIVQAHHGTIEVKSKVGEGSIFRLTLKPALKKEFSGGKHSGLG